MGALKLQDWTLQNWTMTDRCSCVKPAQLLIIGLCSEVDETAGLDRATDASKEWTFMDSFCNIT